MRSRIVQTLLVIACIALTPATFGFDVSALLPVVSPFAGLAIWRVPESVVLALQGLMFLLVAQTVRRQPKLSPGPRAVETTVGPALALALTRSLNRAKGQEVSLAR